MNSLKKSTFSFRYKESNVDILKTLSSQVMPLKRNKLQIAHENILEVLTKKMDLGALTTLDQYYDISLWCFTFLDFQIAPSLEEFERILDRPIKDHDLFPKTWKRCDKAQNSFRFGSWCEWGSGQLGTKGSPQRIHKKVLKRSGLEVHQRRKVGCMLCNIGTSDPWNCVVL